jgi:DNA-binding NtrC family response regulator
MTRAILVIDDELQGRYMLCSAINDKLSYRTIETDSELQASNHLRSSDTKKPDMILFDISKVPNPCEKIFNIKKAEKSIPIVVLVKYGDYDTAMAAVEAGALDFLTKPVSVERMRVTFRNVILLRDLYSVNSNSYVESVMTFSMLADDGNVRKIHELEKEAIHRAIQHYDGCMAEVARRLGIGRSTLYRKLNYTRATATTTANYA